MSKVCSILSHKIKPRAAIRTKQDVLSTSFVLTALGMLYFPRFSRGTPKSSTYKMACRRIKFDLETAAICFVETFVPFSAALPLPNARVELRDRLCSKRSLPQCRATKVYASKKIPWKSVMNVVNKFARKRSLISPPLRMKKRKQKKMHT